MSASRIIPGGGNSGFREIPKIVAELRKKHAAELSPGSWWKKALLEFRIRREAARILRHRLYLSSHFKATGS
jgi:hypothetical protein